MSNSLGLVRFSDGVLRLCMYYGSEDVMQPPLFEVDASRDLFDLWSSDRWAQPRLYMDQPSVTDHRPEPSDTEDVEIFSGYGGGFWWRGRASRMEDTIVSGMWPFGDGTEDDEGELPAVERGWPDWVPGSWLRPATSVAVDP